MTVDLAIGGRTFRATVVPSGGPEAASGSGPVRVLLQPPGDGESLEEHRVSVHETPHGLMLVEAADGRVIDAAVCARGRGEWLVQLRGVDMVVSSNGSRRPSAGAGVPAGDERVTAPMPGRVLRVLVVVGAVVEAGQPLVVIEAMKMENALRAARGGTVREVAVEEGLSVEAGRLLVRIE